MHVFDAKRVQQNAHANTDDAKTCAHNVASQGAQQQVTQCSPGNQSVVITLRVHRVSIVQQDLGVERRTHSRRFLHCRGRPRRPWVRSSRSSCTDRQSILGLQGAGTKCIHAGSHTHAGEVITHGKQTCARFKRHAL